MDAPTVTRRSEADAFAAQFAQATSAPLSSEELRSVVKGIAQAPKKRKGSAHTPSPEVLYKAAIKGGHVRIVRRRGKAPLIQWLDDQGRPVS